MTSDPTSIHSISYCFCDIWLQSFLGFILICDINFRDHIRSKIFQHFETPYIVSTFSLSRTVLHFLSITYCFRDILLLTFQGLTLTFWPLELICIYLGYDVKLIRCVLGMTLNSSVVVQGMTVKLRPCLRFRACGWGCVRWKAPCRKGRGWFVKLTWLALLSLYYIL